jgi:hypothetical protein
MIPEVALGLAILLQQVLHFKQVQGMREEIRLAHNREYAHSIQELATLQHITKPSQSAIHQAIKEGRQPLSDSTSDPRATAHPMGL